MATELFRGGSETMRITSAVSMFPMSSGQGWNHHQVTCRGRLCVEQRNFLRQSPQRICPTYLMKCSYPAGWLSRAICAGCCPVSMKENWPTPLGDLSSSRPFFSLHTRAGIKAPMPWPHPSMITSCLCLRVPLGRVMGRGLQKRFTSESAADAGKDQGHRPSSSCHQGSSFQTIKADHVKEAAQKGKEASQGPSWLLCLSFMGSCTLELFWEQQINWPHKCPSIQRSGRKQTLECMDLHPEVAPKMSK